MKLEELITLAKQYEMKTVAVAAAEDEEVIQAVIEAISLNLAKFILFGDKKGIISLLASKGLEYANHESIKVVHSMSKERSAELAVRAVHAKDADALMKGNIQTSILLKTVLNKEFGLRTGSVLSHVALFEIPNQDRLTIVTDSAMNISPDLSQKVQIINNAVELAQSVGIELPKVAVLAAVEVVNPSMSATVDAAVLTQMNRRGQIKGCIVDGPLALDNAVSVTATKQKGIKSDVAGYADILLVPTIEVGNALYKSLIYFAGAKVGAVVAGAKAPIVLTSRSDTAESKLYSLALAVCYSEK